MADVPPPALSIGDASVTEGNSGTKTVLLTVSLSRAASSPVSVAYASGGGNATAGVDYVAAGSTLSIPAGSSSGTISLGIIGDAVRESTESFLVTLSAPAGATILDGSATVRIQDDDKGKR